MNTRKDGGNESAWAALLLMILTLLPHPALAASDDKILEQQRKNAL